MPDYLGLAQQQDQANQVTTTDIFGQKSPLSLAGQPALPQGGPAAAGVSAAPPTKGGAGVAPQGPGAGGFGDLASGALPEASGGGSGDPGAGEAGAAVGGQGGLPSASAEFGGVTFSGSPFGGSAKGPSGVGVTAGPTGGVSIGTGNPALDTALSFAARSLGFQLGTNAITGLVGLASSPVAGILSSVLGPAAMPFGLVALAHQIAQTQDFSVTNMQNALAQVNPEFHLSEAQAQQIAQYGAKAFEGPMHGGPQAIGNLPFDNPVTNVNASTQAGPASGAGQNLSLAESLSPTPTFAGLAAALGLGTGREDVGGPAPSAPAAPDSGSGLTGGEEGF